MSVCVCELTGLSTGNGLGPEREQDRKIDQMALLPRLLALAWAVVWAVAWALLCAARRRAASGREPVSGRGRDIGDRGKDK